MEALFFIAPLAKCSSSWALALLTLSLHSLAVSLHSCQITCPCFPACAFSSHSPAGAAGLGSAMPVSCLQHQTCIDSFAPVPYMGKESPISYCLGNEGDWGLPGGKRALKLTCVHLGLGVHGRDSPICPLVATRRKVCCCPGALVSDVARRLIA